MMCFFRNLLCLAALGLWFGSMAEEVYLRFDVSMGWGMGTGYTNVNGANFRVEVSEDGTSFQPLWSMVYDRVNQWYPMAVNLREFAGKTIHVRLISEHIENRICQDYPYWGDPRIVTGSLDQEAQFKVHDRLALRKPARMGQLLAPDEVLDFTDTGKFFGYEEVGLATPAMCSELHHGMVFGGENYISVTGKTQPGVYIGFDMGNGFGGGHMAQPEWIERFRAVYEGEKPFHELLGVAAEFPYTGKNVAPVFAEWVVEVPIPEPAPSAKSAPLSPVESQALEESGLNIFGLVRDTYAYQPGWQAQIGAGGRNIAVEAGTKTGWAFAGFEGVGVLRLPLNLHVGGGQKNLESLPNAFAGAVVDFHTPMGYARRVWFAAAEEFVRPRNDRRCADWNLDNAAFSLIQRMNYTETVVLLGSGRQTIDLLQYAPAEWDGRFFFGAGVQNIGAETKLTCTLEIPDAPPVNPAIAGIAEAENMPEHFVLLKDASHTLAISRKNGALCAMWESGSEKQWLKESVDLYQFEQRYSIANADELLDRVEAIELFKNGVRLTCSNLALPDIRLEKTYALTADNGWNKSLAVTMTNPEVEGGFFTWKSAGGITLSAGEMRRGSGFAPAKRVAQGQVLDEADAAPAEQSGRDMPAMVYRPATDETLGVYRSKVNGRFVLLSPSRFPAADSWMVNGVCDYLGGEKTVSCEIRFRRRKGNAGNFLAALWDTPEYREIFELNAPAWVRMLACDAMYTQERVKDIGNAIAPYTSTSCIWFLGFPWGNYGAEHHDPCWNGKHPDVWNIATDYKTETPFTKIDSYHNFLFDEGSDLFRENLQITLFDREGLPLNSGYTSDATKGASYFIQAARPEVRELWCQMVAGQTRRWNFDFVYFDGPGFGVELPDWRTMQVAQSYDWIDLMREMYDRLKLDNPDCVIFCNGIMPFAQIGYIEYRDAQWRDLAGEDWRPLAAELLLFKQAEPRGYVRVPTYGFLAADPAISAYTLYYGWCGNLFFTVRAPWMLAALELRNGRLVPGAVAPDWTEEGGEVEAATFRTDDARWVSVLNHAPEKTVNLEIDLAALGYEQTEYSRIYRWEMELPPPPETEWTAPTGAERRALATRPVMRRKDFAAAHEDNRLALRFDAARMATNVLYFAEHPALILSVDDMPLQMGIRHPQVGFETGLLPEGGLRLIVINKAEKLCFALPGFAAGAVEVRTPRGAKLEEIEIDGEKSATVTIGKGTYVFGIR